MHVEAMNRALTNIPADRVRLHLCWGNFEGPHVRDIPLARIFDIAIKTKAQAISFEGANPRHEHEWKLFKDQTLPEGMILIPGSARLHDELRRAPRAGGGADRALRGTGGPRERDRRHRLRLFHVRASTAHGPSERDWAKFQAMAEGDASRPNNSGVDEPRLQPRYEQRRATPTDAPTPIKSNGWILVRSRISALTASDRSTQRRVRRHVRARQCWSTPGRP